MCTIILPDAHVAGSAVLVFLSVNAYESDAYKWLTMWHVLISCSIICNSQINNYLYQKNDDFMDNRRHVVLLEYVISALGVVHKLRTNKFWTISFIFKE